MAAEPGTMTASAAAPDLDLEWLAGWIAGRRWFGSKRRRVAGLELLDLALLDPAEPPLLLALVEVRFDAGPSEIYQLPLVRGEGGAVEDGLTEPRDPMRILQLLTAGARVGSEAGQVRFEWRQGAAPPPAGARPRPLGGEQSNSSVVFGENAILKAYRRLEDGASPELEVLRFLAERGFAQVPPLLGSYEYRGRRLEATLGILQELLPDGRDGWELTLDGLASDPEALLGPVRGLGQTIGALHAALASAPDDPAFAPEELGAGFSARLVAALDDEIERVFSDLPEDDERLAPIAGAAESLRERVRALAAVADPGMAIRVHGDLHLGQALLADRGWAILDFEGEPARPLPERRAKHSPLRDVAGILRSLAYAPLAARLQRGADPPAGWEARARAALLDGYLASADPALLPASRSGREQLLSLYELEKAVYELRYELDHRPDWVEIPVAGIARLLEAAAR
ncbi:MAG TPA: hypothetical protein VGG40_04555 [Solirubrobacterales bacterium]|jgi:maltokinase